MRTYNSIETEFRSHFGEAGNFSWCNFRPCFDGNLIDISVTIPPATTANEIKETAWSEFQRVWLWLRARQAFFDDEDLLQVVIGFPKAIKPEGGRQMIKGQLKVKDLSRLAESFGFEAFNGCGGACQELVNWAVLIESFSTRST